MAPDSPRPVVHTVGHSTHDLPTFLGLLKAAGITAVADVRSSPHSRHTPWFNRPELKRSLAAAGIAYSFLGRELGARPDDRSCYRDGVARYELIARSDLFAQGLERVLAGARAYRIALMCAEKDPLDCHRNVLVARALAERGADIRHILANGVIEPNAETERRLLSLLGRTSLDMFAPAEEQAALAYAERAARIAYAEAAEEAAERAAE